MNVVSRTTRLPRAALMLAALLAVAALLPTPALAQRPRPSVRLIAAAGDCITSTLDAALTEPAYTEELDEGWRIAVSLRGRPDLQGQGLQSPPPVQDERAAVDIVQLLPMDPIPDFVDNMSAFLMVNQRDNQRFVVEIAGYFYLGLRSAASDCLERSSGGLWTFQPL